MINLHNILEDYKYNKRKDRAKQDHKCREAENSEHDDQAKPL